MSLLEGGVIMTKYNHEQFIADITAIIDELRDTLIKKNYDYGNSVESTIDKRGYGSLAQRIEDKLNRFDNLILKEEEGQVDESLEDTLLDLAGYALLGVRKLRKDKTNQQTNQAEEIKNTNFSTKDFDEEWRKMIELLDMFLNQK